MPGVCLSICLLFYLFVSPPVSNFTPKLSDLHKNITGDVFSDRKNLLNLEVTRNRTFSKDSSTLRSRQGHLSTIWLVSMDLVDQGRPV